MHLPSDLDDNWMSPIHGKVSLVQVKEPYGNLDMVTPAEARVRQKDVIVNAEKYFYNPASKRVAQSVTCLARDACLTAYPGVASSISVRLHTFVEIDHEIISAVILLPSADAFKKDCCQLQAKVCAQITG